MIETSHHPAAVALSLAGVDASMQKAILRQVAHRLDRTAAIQRRDKALREAFHLVGHVRILAGALTAYRASVWPCVRHLAQAPAADTPLRQAFFRACQASDDAGVVIPGARQIRRLVT
jgi:hypothetical protein